jgi:hypothetical protein
MLSAIITGVLIIAFELHAINRRVKEMREMLYDISLEISVVTATGVNLGVIGERVTINGEKGKSNVR